MQTVWGLQVRNGLDSAKSRRDSRVKGEALVLRFDQQSQPRVFSSAMMMSINPATADANEGIFPANYRLAPGV